jgi:hypothetical protein
MAVAASSEARAMMEASVQRPAEGLRRPAPAGRLSWSRRPKVKAAALLALLGLAGLGGAPRVLAISQYALLDVAIVAQDGDLQIGSAVSYYGLAFTQSLREQMLPIIVFNAGGRLDPYTQGYLDNLEANAALGQDLVDGAPLATNAAEEFAALKGQIAAAYATGGNSSDPDYLQGWSDAYGYSSYLLDSVIGQVATVTAIAQRTWIEIAPAAPVAVRSAGPRGEVR